MWHDTKKCLIMPRSNKNVKRFVFPREGRTLDVFIHNIDPRLSLCHCSSLPVTSYHHAIEMIEMIEFQPKIHIFTENLSNHHHNVNQNLLTYL